MLTRTIQIVNCLCLLLFIAACSRNNQEPIAVTPPQPAIKIEQSNLAPVSPITAQKIAKHYETALEASRNADWASVEAELQAIKSLTTDPSQLAVAEVLVGKLKANDSMEVMVHIMKLLSQPTDQSPVYVWYREIYRHAKLGEWSQLEVELQETMKIAPAEAQETLNTFLTQVQSGATSTLAQEIQQYTGVTEE